MTFNPSLGWVKVDPHTKNQGQRSNGSNRRARTNTQTRKRTLPSALSPSFAVDKYQNAQKHCFSPQTVEKLMMIFTCVHSMQHPNHCTSCNAGWPAGEDEPSKGISNPLKSALRTNTLTKMNGHPYMAVTLQPFAGFTSFNFWLAGPGWQVSAPSISWAYSI